MTATYPRGTAVTVRQRPLEVDGVTFERRRWRGIVQCAADPDGKPYGDGAYVMDAKTQAVRFVRWDEMTPARPTMMEREMARRAQVGA